MRSDSVLWEPTAPVLAPALRKIRSRKQKPPNGGSYLINRINKLQVQKEENDRKHEDHESYDGRSDFHATGTNLDSTGFDVVVGVSLIGMPVLSLHGFRQGRLMSEVKLHRRQV